MAMYVSQHTWQCMLTSTINVAYACDSPPLRR